jgi:hypothetical protein
MKMKNRPINVFLLDDEFPVLEEFRKKGIYNSAISTKDLNYLSINCKWNHLVDLQLLIKDVLSSKASIEGLINLVGFSTPTQALSEINKGVLPDVIIYDWEYLNAPIHSLNSKNWLIEILNKTKAFVFIYSKMRDELPRFLNTFEFTQFSKRFQLFLKGGKIEFSFSAEEFIFQYIIGAASGSGNIKINGIKIEFSSNNYLSSASDILLLQRILGKKNILKKLSDVNFIINDASIEKILNDSSGYLLFNAEKRILIDPDEDFDEEKIKPVIKLSYLEVVKRFSIVKLEDTLERGILPI